MQFVTMQFVTMQFVTMQFVTMQFVTMQFVTMQFVVGVCTVHAHLLGMKRTLSFDDERTHVLANELKRMLSPECDFAAD